MSERATNKPSRRPRGPRRGGEPEEPLQAEFLGNPDPDRDSLPPPHHVVMQTGITVVAVAVIVLFPLLTLAVLMLLGMPAFSAAVIGASVAPLIVLARAIAKHYYRR